MMDTIICSTTAKKMDMVEINAGTWM